MFKIVIFIFSFLFIYSSEKLSAQTQKLDLNYFLSQGLQNSPLLKDYQNQVNSASLDSLLVKAGQKPKVDANAQALYAPVYNNFGYDEASTNGGNYTGVISISQNLFNGRDLRNKYEASRIQKQSFSNTYKISGNELSRAITAQYLTAYADFSDLSFDQSFLKIMTAQREILQKLVESGLYKQTDYLSLLIETQTQEIAIKQTTNQYDKDVRLLYQLCGLADTSQIELSPPVITRKDVSNPALSPLFIQYSIDSLKITNSKTAVDMQYRPKLNWFADAGLLSTDPSTLNRHLGYSVGVNFSIPLYDGKQRKLQYQKLDFAENTRSNYRQFFKKQYNQQVVQLERDLSSAHETLEQMKQQRKASEELMNMVKTLLNSGNISITEFINAAKNYNAINRSFNQTQLKELQIINELNYWMQ